MGFDSKIKIINLIALLIIISAAVAVIWCAPSFFKGYPATEIWGEAVLSRNYYQKGFF